MKKPKMKRNVAITNQFEEQGIIYFYASDTIAECAKEFGKARSYTGKAECWILDVDARYDFYDVLAWLESFN